MFKSFFPRPGLFFSSAALWSLLAIFVWFGFASDLPAHFWPAFQAAIKQPLPTTVMRFIAPGEVWFYAYYWLMVAIFAIAWRLTDNHPWQRWSVWGSALIIFVTWFGVQVGVAVNAWYGPFYDLIQKALTKAGSVQINEFYAQVMAFLGIALIAVVIGVMNAFFISHWVFRWRTAMNNYYMHHWQRLRHVEGAAQRVQEDTMRFATTLESWGVNFIQAIMTLVAFLPVLIALSHHVENIPILGNLPYALVIAAVLWSLFGTGLLALVGIKLPGLEFRNQRVEAAYRKELVYGEDNADRATPPTVNVLFNNVRVNYFRLYFHYLYFNISRILYLQVDNVFGLFLLFPSIVAGTITLGLLNQITNVFDQVRSSFQYLITSWSTLVELMSIYKRLRSFEQILDDVPHGEMMRDASEDVS
ncbi:microcin B17 transporter [Pantoea ananatis]|uniref:peptide antibiotic transporter SbmA n=1 Tax=Pantoea ananas TaxID=553 RepID=UPI0007366806|nr:peptide antibiotic transporter SbmA [Pantoea ananatis]AWQ20379.1 peptide antibiotic transporter SbmA [Pantoea ananatis]KTR47080.1 microcin B17 transporter [Pantoea ananatis]KTR57093.1 microcin B17 transporter [Pantoea ananatis]KTR62912.1 microcin B17 transporter [Pantoea ananatis]KTR71692.1 microcin B17 transporter [Pantoea ananatis]